MNQKFFWLALPILLLIVGLTSILLVQGYKEKKEVRSEEERLANFSQKCDFFDYQNWAVFNDPQNIFSIKYPNCWISIVDDYYGFQYWFTRKDIDSSKYIPAPLVAPYLTIGGPGTAHDYDLIREEKVIVDGHDATKRIYKNSITLNIIKDFLLPGNQVYGGVGLKVVYDANDNLNYEALMDKIAESFEFK
jgi:hypothetical protein